MGIAILAIFSIGLFQIGKWASSRFINKPRAALATEATQSVQSEVSSEPNWSGYEAPTFVRRGLPFPVLTVKAKARRMRKTKAALNPEVESFPTGDWTLFSAGEGEIHATH
jgi:hypothetical protein